MILADPVATPPSLSPEERLMRAFEEMVNPETFNGACGESCLCGQLARIFCGGYWKIPTLASQFDVPFMTVHRIFRKAGPFGTNLEGALAMAREELGLEPKP